MANHDQDNDQTPEQTKAAMGQSKHKLGHMLSLPVVPFMPVAAQVSKWGHLHVRLMEGSPEYLTGSAQASVTPEAFKEIAAALKTAVKEPSYSGSGSDYYHLEVKPSADGTSCDLYCGLARVCQILVRPDAIIFSAPGQDTGPVN